jgi:hypothetical protein
MDVHCTVVEAGGTDIVCGMSSIVFQFEFELVG